VNTLYATALPALTEDDRWVTHIGIRVTSAGAAGASALVGVYADDRGLPGRRVLWAELPDLNTSAAFAAVLPEAVVLPPTCWVVSIFASSGAFPTVSATLNNMGADFNKATLGFAGPNSSFLLPPGSNSHAAGVRAAWTYAQGLPPDSRDIPWAVLNAGALFPLVGVRLGGPRPVNGTQAASRNLAATPGSPALPQALPTNLPSALPSGIPLNIG
jgi:hypothetical protein